jgi:hypothetical protein
MHFEPPKKGGNHVRKSFGLVILLALPALAQVTGGQESVQDAVRFERQKDAASARQARIEARRSGNSSADRESDENAPVRKNAKPSKSKTGSDTRSRQQQ